MSKYWQLKVPRTKLLSILLILVPPVAVFFFFRSFLLDQILENALIDQGWIFSAKGIYLVALTLSAIFSSIILQRIKRKRFFTVTLIYRIVALCSILFFQNGLLILIPCILLGSSFGLGFPSDLSFLSDNTEVEERGKVSGIALCLTFVTVIVLMIISMGMELSIMHNMVVCIIVQIITGGVILVHPSWENPSRISVPISRVMENRTFLLYMVPWVMFSFVNGAVEFLWQMLDTYEVQLGAIIAQYIASIVFFIVAGLFSDYYGRKPTLLIGFVTLGFSYFLVPSVESIVIDYIVSIFSGIAWSFIMVSFLFAIVGDLSPLGGREVFFAISGLFWMVVETGFAFISSAVVIKLPVSIVSSILSLVMFLAIIPLLTVPETLPQNKISDRRISDYFEKVLKTLEEKND